MITNETKEQILEASRIEEVVGEFVVLKKRGSNLLGLCPFHNERTPSFTVSPVKGFFKCFGCGKAGDSVTFIMEHESLTFPEALRYLAKKYNIEIAEERPSEEVLEAQSLRENLFVITTYAQQFFEKQCWESEEGKAIGLSYFRERGFTDETIRKFGLGYAPDRWDGLTSAAIADGYKLEYLEKTGLTIVQENKQYDRFRGRVIFPIYNLSGRVIAFGARILKADPKSPKYLNSPETDIYHKSKSLYGISFARRVMSSADQCYLVEGYTDVISMHQAGIENVVASSGTSLTVEQIRMIGRFTKNITVLYDGDPAGIKASLRGIDLILEEGMNVRVLLFPDGDDPDSFAKKVTTQELKDYLTNEAVDFISFKTRLLLKDTERDPIKKAGLIHDIVDTIAKVPDAIMRSAYLRQTSDLMEIEETVLISELNKLLRQKAAKQPVATPPSGTETVVDPFLPESSVEEQPDHVYDTTRQEEEIIRILLEYADHRFILVEPDQNVDEEENNVHRVKDFIVNEIYEGEFHFSNASLAGLFAEFAAQVEQGVAYDQQQFFAQLSPEIKPVAVTMITPPYELANWESKGIVVNRDEHNLSKAVIDPVIYLKKKQLLKMRKDLHEELKAREAAGLPFDELLERDKELLISQSLLNKYTNTIIQR
jgi:DNA primase